VVVGELLVAVLLILGLFTAVGSLGSAFLVLNYMLMKGLVNNAGSIDRVFFLASVLFLATSAGLVWGLDGPLRAVIARASLVRWLTGLSGLRPEHRQPGARTWTAHRSPGRRRSDTHGAGDPALAP